MVFYVVLNEKEIMTSVEKQMQLEIMLNKITQTQKNTSTFGNGT